VMKFSFGQLLQGKRLADRATDSRRRIVGRVNKEIIQPVTALPRQLIVGSIGSAFIAVGLGFFLVGSLRLTQHFWAFQGNTSWLAYMVVWLEAVLLGSITLWRIFASAKKRRSRS